MKHIMTLYMKIFLQIYDVVWLAVIPFLRFSKRLSEGFENRTLERVDFSKVDIWVHAASAGEAYIARQILKTIKNSEKLKILVTTNTSQGKDILEKPLKTSMQQITVSYVPFDRPSIVKKAVAIADPRLLLLIESEIWPGLMSEMKKAGKTILVVNGRMTQRSFSRYLMIKFIWPKLKPETILAISEEDRKRFALLFQQEKTYHVSNIKFDRLKKCQIAQRDESSVRFLVLASIRKEEEEKVLFVIEELLKRIPDLQVGLFPRHMHRLSAWEELLTEKKISWGLRSRLPDGGGASKVILWDVFGELGEAYRRADGAFVGGSLEPLGGQNFIEAFMNGVIPVTGPHVSNFLWAGEEVYEEGLVKKGNTKEEVVELLLETLNNQIDSSIIQEKADRYISAKQGGSVETCRHIVELLESVN